MCREGRRLMKFVIQRVKEASVKVDGEYTGKIKNGYLVLIGVGHEDTKEEAENLIKEMSEIDTIGVTNEKQREAMYKNALLHT